MAEHTCPDCHGVGHVGPATGARVEDYGRACARCDGTGLLMAEHTEMTDAAFVEAIREDLELCGEWRYDEVRRLIEILDRLRARIECIEIVMDGGGIEINGRPWREVVDVALRLASEVES